MRIIKVRESNLQIVGLEIQNLSNWSKLYRQLLTRYDTIIVGKKRLRVKFVRSTKRHEFAARVFFIPFWQGGLCLRQVALSLSVQPFTNIVGNYIRHNGDYNG